MSLWQFLKCDVLLRDFKVFIDDFCVDTFIAVVGIWVSAIIII